MAPETLTPLGAGRPVPPPEPLPDDSWSTIALMAATCVPLFFATTLYTGEGTDLRVRIRGNYE